MQKFLTFTLLIISWHLHGFNRDLHVFECPYFAIGGGVVIPSKNSSSTDSSNSVLFSPTVPGTSLFNLPQVTWKNEYKTGFEFYALAGLPLSCYCRTDLEFVYQYLRREISGFYSWREINTATLNIFAENFDNPIRHVSTDAHLFCLLPNLYFDYFARPCWNFYIGGGFGIAWLKSTSTTQDSILIINTVFPPLVESSSTIEKSPSLGGTAFAMQFKLGTTFDILPNLGLGLNYRLLGTTQFHASKSSITTNPQTPGQAVFKTGQKQIRGFLNNSINVSLVYTY